MQMRLTTSHFGQTGIRVAMRALVVMMSGHTAGENLDTLRQEGLAGFIEKPVRLRKLAELIGSLLEVQEP